jgi:hypothetical protein
MFQRQPPLRKLVEIFWAGGEEHRHGRMWHSRAAAYPIRECWTGQPVAKQCDSLADWTDRGGELSARVDHAMLVSCAKGSGPY